MPVLSQKNFWLIVGGLAGFELLSWMVYHTGAMSVAFWTAAAAMLLLVWYRPSWVALAGLAELIVGSKGYLLFTVVGGQHLTLRMLLFTGLCLVVIRLWPKIKHDFPQSVSKALLLLVGWIGLMAIWGALRGNGVSAVYTDANAFAYLGVYFGWWLILRRQPNWRGQVLTILLAGGTLIGLKSWLMVLLFGQNAPGLTELYRWIRNTGVGEITLISHNVYRVFFQSQVYALLVFLIAFSGYLWRQVPRWWAWPLIASALGVYFSLSRSFWLGLAGALLLMGVWLIRRIGWTSLKRFWLLVPLGLAVWLFNAWALNWPYVFNPPGDRPSVNTVLARLSGESSKQAASARQNQIQPLIRAISKHPVLGSGFGTMVTYYSTDPRIRGWRTTAAFELGYLDLWLKTGLVGLGLYVWWLWRIHRRIWPTKWLAYFVPGVAALLITNLTSPYLNHPLGLGWLALVSLYADDP